MEKYRKFNTILGWVVFLIASTVYLVTAEPTASFWDCGEYIATAYKLQVGHPPGAPFFQLLGRFFTLFAFGNEELVARMINSMSALASGFTILFLFWTLTMLARKIVDRNNEMDNGKMYMVLGSALVGSLAYTFTDSFWFSAVEGEVYAMSSFFTAVVFWAILKWEEGAEEKHAFRWIILIAYLMGLSIGVHLLNLLAIPAITFVYYFKKYKPTPKGFVVALVVSIALLAIIMNGIIPWIVQLASAFELFFVNSLGLPFNSGTILYFLLLIAGIVFSIRYTRKHQKTVLNTAIWGFTFILIGYSSFFLLIIRSNADTPINENRPRDAISLLAYLNREQYGDWPISHGQYYNSPVIEREDGRPVYRKDAKSGKYIIGDDRKGTKPVYDPQFTTIFPRMWNNTEQRYISDYKTWGKIRGIPVTSTDEYGETTTLYKPTFAENLRYFFRYQINHMYVRYFMWNFAGRQNDIQGRADRKNGNWITGIKFLDEARLGPVSNVPISLNSKARNTYYLFPLALGLFGFLFHFKKDWRGFTVVGLLFGLTGIAIVIYLNQHSPQPRERDYAFAASFYAFAIWIGIGALGLITALKKYVSSNIAVVSGTAICLVLVPGILAQQNWNDHDRSGRYTALAMANNYLNSCAPNAILFTNGDNDTFPLWYAQEVEGIRRDVRVVNLSLLNTEWYIDAMSKKAYESDPVPFTLKSKHYRDANRNVTYFLENENIKGYVELKDLFNIVVTDESKLQVNTAMGLIDYFPTKSFKLSVDSARVLSNGTVHPSLAGEILPDLRWKLNRSGVTKNYLMMLDFLATNNWERPVYYAITTGSDAYISLEEYFQLEGLAYRLIPVRTTETDGQTGRINTEVMYDNLMNKFQFGNLNDPSVFLDETNMRMTMNLRNNFHRLSNALIEEGKYDSARVVMDKSLEVMPDETVPFNYFVLPIMEGYFEIGDTEKAVELATRLLEIFDEQLLYYFSFQGQKGEAFEMEKQQNLAMLDRLKNATSKFGQNDLSDRATSIFDIYFELYTNQR